MEDEAAMQIASGDEEGILTAWALRFDGWKYCEESEWLEEDRLAVTDRLVNRQKIPADPLKQLALFFLLQRYLCKWGGEQLGPRTPEWRAFRTLFLLTANQEIEPRWRHGEWYDRWTRHYLPRAAEFARRRRIRCGFM